MFQFKHDFNEYYCGVRDPQVARRLNPSLQTFAQWLSEHRDQVPVE